MNPAVSKSYPFPRGNLAGYTDCSDGVFGNPVFSELLVQFTRKCSPALFYDLLAVSTVYLLFRKYGMVYRTIFFKQNRTA